MIIPNVINESEDLTHPLFDSLQPKLYSHSFFMERHISFFSVSSKLLASWNAKAVKLQQENALRFLKISLKLHYLRNEMRAK